MNPVKRQVSLYPFLIVLLSFFIFSPVWAEEIPVTLSADEVEYLENGKMAVARGKVDIRSADIRLTAEKVTFWIEKEELLAEGNVVLYGKTDVIRGEKIKYNFKKNKGELLDARTYHEPWFAEGKEVERIGKDALNIHRGSMTTCDLEKPHYRITAKRIDIYLDKKEIIAHHCFFIVGRIPICYFPYYRRSFEDKRSRVTIIPGHSSDWGTYVLGGYNFDLTKVIYGTLHADWRDKKGWAEGVDLKYHSQERRGFWQGYYIREKDKEAGTRKDRWRAEISHREQLKENIVGTFEVHRMSDINFRKDYFYDDYVNKSQPETYLSLTGVYPRWNWNILAKKRVNKFYSVTERLPEIQVNFPNQKVWDTPFYYKGHYHAAYLDKKIADVSGSSDEASRVDTYNQVSYPVKVFHWLNLNPYLGMRETWYSKDINGEDAWRSMFYSGFEANTRISRIFDVESEKLDIHRLRHLITPTVRYEYRTTTAEPSELIQFDNVDTLDKLNFVHLGLENKLQTKRMVDARMQSVDLAAFKIESGFHLKKPSDEKRWKNIRAKLDLRPKNWLGFGLDSYTDPYDGKLEMMNTDFSLYGKDDIWSFTLGNRYEDGANEDIYGGLKWKLTPKWTIDLYERFDFSDNKFEEQRYNVYRDLHCWMSSFSYVKRRDETELWLMLWIKAFPEMPLSFSIEAKIWIHILTLMMES